MESTGQRTSTVFPQRSMDWSPRSPTGLHQLHNSTELHQTVEKERMYTEQHKINYKKLKTEFLNLKKEYDVMEREFNSMLEANKQSSESYQRQISEAHSKMADIRGEMTELRPLQLSDQKLDAVKTEVSDSLTGLYRDRFARADNEMSSYRAEEQELLHELASIKQELEREQREYALKRDQLSDMQETELSNLLQNREELIMEQSQPDDSTERLKVLYRENSHLKTKVKAVVVEMEEVNLEIGQLSSRKKDLLQNRDNEKLTSLQSTVRKLNEEREKIAQEMNDLSKEVASERGCLEPVVSRNQELQTSVSTATIGIDAAVGEGSRQLSQAKLEVCKMRGEVDRDRDMMKGRIEEATFRLDQSHATIRDLESRLADSDKAISRRELSVREEEWIKLKRVEDSKGELESQLVTAERRLREMESTTSEVMDKIADRDSRAITRAGAATSECAKLRSQIAEVLQPQLTELRALVQRDELQASTLHTEVTQTAGKVAQMEGVRLQTVRLKESLREVQNRADQSMRTAEVSVVDAQRVVSGNKAEMERRIAELESAVVSVEGRIQTAIGGIKMTNKKYKNNFNQLKQRLQMAEAKLLQLETEKISLNKSVTQEEYSKAKRELKDLKKRYKDWGNIVLGPEFNDKPKTRTSEERKREATELTHLKEAIEKLDIRHQSDMAAVQSSINQ